VEYKIAASGLESNMRIGKIKARAQKIIVVQHEKD
jgi:hypothetical protein